MKRYIVFLIVLCSSEIMGMGVDFSSPNYSVVDKACNRIRSREGFLFIYKFNEKSLYEFDFHCFENESIKDLPVIYDKSKTRENIIKIYGPELQQKLDDLRNNASLPHISYMHDSNVLSMIFSHHYMNVFPNVFTVSTNGDVRTYDFFGKRVSSFNVGNELISAFFDRYGASLKVTTMQGGIGFWNINGYEEPSDAWRHKDMFIEDVYESSEVNSLIEEGYSFGDYEGEVKYSRDGNYALTKENNIVRVWDLKIYKATDINDLTLEQLSFLWMSSIEKLQASNEKQASSGRCIVS